MGYFSARLNRSITDKTRSKRISCSGASVGINSTLPQVSLALTRFYKSGNMGTFAEFFPRLECMKSLIYTQSQYRLASTLVNYLHTIPTEIADHLFLRLQNSHTELDLKLQICTKVDDKKNRKYFLRMKSENSMLYDELRNSSGLVRRAVKMISNNNTFTKEECKFITNLCKKSSPIEYTSLIIKYGFFTESSNEFVLGLSSTWMFSKYLTECPKKRWATNLEQEIMKMGKDWSLPYINFLKTFQDE